LLAVADEVLAAHALERCSQHGPVVGIVVSQERLMQAPNLQTLRHVYFLARARNAVQRILARVIHRRGRRHRPRQEGLHLVGAVAVLLEPQRKLEHVIVGRARVRCDEVRDQVLLLARALRVPVE
jgi:hypothetical protein